MSIDPTTETSPSARPAKLQAKRKAKSLQTVEVPASGPGTYRAANKSIRPTTSAGALIRYDVRSGRGSGARRNLRQHAWRSGRGLEDANVSAITERALL
jgi:hypothetical protein